MKKLLFALLLSFSALASAKVINIEFNFSPYVGDPAKADHVEIVPGKASVFINNVPIASQEIEKQEVPVLFDNREIGTAVWVPASSMGQSLRKGKNKIRIEFVPTNAKAPYDAQLRWAAVTDQVTHTENGPGRGTSTNQSDEGADNRKKIVGKVVFEREFSADFATDLPWHHFAVVTALTDADRQELAALVAARAEVFKPDFSAAYTLLKSASTPGMQLDLAGIKKSRILDKGYAAGIRMVAPPADSLDFVITGNPEVVVRAKTGNLYSIDPKAIARLKGDELQMGMAMILSVLCPPQMVFVRDTSGKWAVVF